MQDHEHAERESVIAARLAALTAQCGDHLDEAAQAQVREGIAKLYDAAQLLRACPLANADEFDFVYTPAEG